MTIKPPTHTAKNWGPSAGTRAHARTHTMQTCMRDGKHFNEGALEKYTALHTGRLP